MAQNDYFPGMKSKKGPLDSPCPVKINPKVFRHSSDIGAAQTQTAV
jgi:hypothetical protein